MHGVSTGPTINYGYHFDQCFGKHVSESVSGHRRHNTVNMLCNFNQTHARRKQSKSQRTVHLNLKMKTANSARLRGAKCLEQFAKFSMSGMSGNTMTNTVEQS